MSTKTLSSTEWKDIIRAYHNNPIIYSPNNPLDNSILFDKYHYCEPEVRKTTEQIKQILQVNKSQTLKNIIWNLYRAYQFDLKWGSKHYVAVSLNEADYKGETRWHQLHLSHTKIRRFIGQLEEQKLIEVHLGWFDTRTQIGKRTRICATDTLIEYFRKHSIKPIYSQPKFPVLVEGTKGGFVQPPNIDTFNRMCKRLDRINKSNNSHEVSIDLGLLLYYYTITNGVMDKKEKASYVTCCYALQIPVLEPENFCILKPESLTLKRRFKDSSFDVYGRFEAPIQALPSKSKKFRQLLKIDGETTVELDYSNTFPAICYAELGMELKEDAYDIDGYERNEVKRTLNIMLNCKSRCSAIKATMKHFGNIKPYLYYQKLVRSIEAKHQPLMEFFYTDAWKWLMRRESDIAEKIMLHFVRLKECIIPIHDSFVVRAGMEEELRDAMINVWKEFNDGIKPRITTT